MASYQAGFIGCGHMGGALARMAGIRAGSGKIAVVDHHPENTERLRSVCGAMPVTAAEAAEKSRFLFLGVKPQALRTAAAEIQPVLRRRIDNEEHFTVVSMAAGVTVSAVSDLLEGVPVIRILPNTPVEVGEGILLYCCGTGVSAEDEADFLKLMEPAGCAVKIEERLMDAAGTVSGCGPAYLCLILEALTDGAVRCGVPRRLAVELSARMLLGTAKLVLETGQDPALLRGAVCSPAGSTIEGIAVLEERAVRSAILEAVSAAVRRTGELGK